MILQDNQSSKNDNTVRPIAYNIHVCIMHRKQFLPL